MSFDIEVAVSTPVYITFVPIYANDWFQLLGAGPWLTPIGIVKPGYAPYGHMIIGGSTGAGSWQILTNTPSSGTLSDGTSYAHSTGPDWLTKNGTKLKKVVYSDYHTAQYRKYDGTIVSTPINYNERARYYPRDGVEKVFDSDVDFSVFFQPYPSGGPGVFNAIVFSQSDTDVFTATT